MRPELDAAHDIECGGCHRAIPRAVDGPCPDCGSLNRVQPLSASLSFVGLFAARMRRTRLARRWGEVATRYERGGLGRLVHFRRWFDKDADRYEEHVEDAATGEVIHHADEPLSEHRGHGSARTDER